MFTFFFAMPLFPGYEDCLPFFRKFLPIFHTLHHMTKSKTDCD